MSNAGILQGDHVPIPDFDWEGFVRRRATYEPLGIGSPRQWDPVA